MLSEARGGLLQMRSEAKEEKLSVAWNKTSAALSPSRVKRPRDDDTGDAGAILSPALPSGGEAIPTALECFQELPRRVAERNAGQKYISNDLVVSWNGKRLLCEHGRQKTHCKDCGGSAFCEHGRQKAHCKDCGGSCICEHGRRKSHCKDCGGSMICEHGRQKHVCADCLSIEDIIRSKNKCNACGAGIKNKRQAVGLCANCDHIVRERIELQARRLILKHMPYPYNRKENWSALDTRMIGGESCNTGRRRPDAMMVLEDRVIGIEIDESSHCGRELSCEIAKLDDHRWGVGEDAKPAVCIRLNPDLRCP